MPVEASSPIGLYGNLPIFQERLKEGYTGVSFGQGEWVNNRRIVVIWVFYGPDGKVATYEHHKARTPEGASMRGPSETRIMTETSFVIFAKEWRLKVDPVRHPLEPIVEKMA
jgi:hypothetical protein